MGENSLGYQGHSRGSPFIEIHFQKQAKDPAEKNFSLQLLNVSELIGNQYYYILHAYPQNNSISQNQIW